MAFSSIAPGTDENPQPGERPPALVTRLARAKAAAVAARQPDAWVIGSDQIAVRADENGAESMLGKPGTAIRCVEQLRFSSGRSVAFLTAVAVMRRESGALFEFMDTTRVAFRVLDEATIQRYVAKEQPLDCAGGFKSEGLGIALCESIDSADPTALVGLPLIPPGRGAARGGLRHPLTFRICSAARRFAGRSLVCGLRRPLGRVGGARFRRARRDRWFGGSRRFGASRRFGWAALQRRDGVDHRGQLRGQRRADVEWHPGARPLERHRLGVQECAFQTMRLEIGIALAIAVLVIAQQRMAGEGGMHANLVSASGGDRWGYPLPSRWRASRRTARA